jgi:hypothetical protein
VALVDSQFQLLSLFEAIVTETAPEPDVVVTRGVGSARLLELGADLLGDARVVADPRPAALIRLIERSTDIAVGDPYSSLVQAVTASSRRRRFTFVDDGAATLRALATLARDGTLTRAHSVTPGRTAISRLGTRGLHRSARRGNVTLVTGQPLALPVRTALDERGFRVVVHDFAWSQRVPLAQSDRFGEAVRHVVLGSSLASDGLLRTEWYVEWLERVLGAGDDIVFVPHRRDLPAAAAVATRRGIESYRGDAGLPVELIVRDLPDGLIVDTLPSTAALTIPAVRAKRTTEVRCALPPDAVMTSRSTPEMNELLRLIEHHTTA